MTKVTIELDLSIVQKAIKAEVKPAVQEVLARHYDIPAMIADELLREPTEKERKEEQNYYPFLLSRYEPAIRGREMVDGLIRSAIKSAADEYVKVVIDERRDTIYEAFRKMMANSPDRLVNAFVEMIEGADLSLDLATTLSVNGSERDCD